MTTDDAPRPDLPPKVLYEPSRYRVTHWREDLWQTWGYFGSLRGALLSAARLHRHKFYRARAERLDDDGCWREVKRYGD